MRVITLNDDAALIDYAQLIVNELRANMVRVDTDFSAMSVTSTLWPDGLGCSVDVTTA